ncbi:MAG: AbrB/MazE/SpoVT family DNA-binding domain-containing protein [Nakamurella sp.]
MKCSSFNVVIDRWGKLAIPAEIMTAMGLRPGSRLELRLQGDQLVLEHPDGAVTALRRLGSEVPAGRSLVAELLAERRLSAGTD